MNDIEPPSPLLNPEDFAALVGHQLPVRWQSGKAPFTLTALTPLPAHAYREKPFVLTLSGPTDQQISQGTCAVTHPTLGELMIFLVPIRSHAGLIEYEATFN